MIVTSKFIHYHLPRTGGLAFTKLCNTFLGDDIQYQKDTASWLVPQEYSEELLAVIVFRSLPSWIMSVNLNQFNPANPNQRSLGRLEEIRENTVNGKILYEGQWDYVDTIYGQKLNCLDFSNTIALKQENLLQDFDKMLQSLYGKSTAGYKIANKFNKLKYPKFMLNDEDIDNIYNSNPIWKKVEAKIYYES